MVLLHSNDWLPAQSRRVADKLQGRSRSAVEDHIQPIVVPQALSSAVLVCRQSHLAHPSAPDEVGDLRHSDVQLHECKAIGCCLYLIRAGLDHLQSHQQIHTCPSPPRGHTEAGGEVQGLRSAFLGSPWVSGRTDGLRFQIVGRAPIDKI